MQKTIKGILLTNGVIITYNNEDMNNTTGYGLKISKASLVHPSGKFEIEMKNVELIDQDIMVRWEEEEKKEEI